MYNYKQGEIIVVPVPFSDLTSTKRRPVLVISNKFNKNEFDDYITVAITSNINQKGIKISNENLIEGSLPKDSLIRTDKIYTLNAGIFVKKIGTVNVSTLIDAEEQINRIISVENE